MEPVGIFSYMLHCVNLFLVSLNNKIINSLNRRNGLASFSKSHKSDMYGCEVYGVKPDFRISAQLNKSEGGNLSHVFGIFQ